MDKHSAQPGLFWRLFHRQHGPTEWQKFRAQTPSHAPANEPKPQILINPMRLKAMARSMRTPEWQLPTYGAYLIQHGCTLPEPRHTDAIPPVVTIAPVRPDDTGAFLLDKRDALFDDVPVSGPLEEDGFAPTVLHPRTKFRNTMSQLLPPVESEDKPA